jgi:hypothetical protein
MGTDDRQNVNKENNLIVFEEEAPTKKDYKFLYRLIIGSVLIGVGMSTSYSYFSTAMIVWGVIRICSVLFKR